MVIKNIKVKSNNGILPLELGTDLTESTARFEQSSARANITSGERLSAVFGKIRKFFADLKPIAFSGKAADLTTDASHCFVSETEKSEWNGANSQLTNLTGNLSGTCFSSGDVFSWANGRHASMSASFSSSCANLPSSSAFDVFRIEHGGGLASLLAIRESDRKLYLSCYNSVSWSAWQECLVREDLSDYLPLAGGQMRGSINGSGDTFLGSRKNGYNIWFRNDGSNFYILLSDQNASSWNRYRPFMISLTSGTAYVKDSPILTVSDIVNSYTSTSGMPCSAAAVKYTRDTADSAHTKINSHTAAYSSHVAIQQAAPSQANLWAW